MSRMSFLQSQSTCAKNTARKIEKQTLFVGTSGVTEIDPVALEKRFWALDSAVTTNPHTRIEVLP